MMFTSHVISNSLRCCVARTVYLYVIVCLPTESCSRVGGLSELGSNGQLGSGSDQLTTASVSPELTLAFTNRVGHLQAISIKSY